MLLTCGYENTVNIHKIEPKYKDSTAIGQLVGHNAMVTAVACIRNSPMVVTADDQGVIKVWDIRELKCVQSLDLGYQNNITRLLDIGDKGKICFIGCRVNFIRFNEEIKEEKQIHCAIEMEMNKAQDTLIMATPKDLRFIHMATGKTTKIYSGILQNPDDEITCFKCINQFKKILVGDYNGNLNIFSYDSGELFCHLKKHEGEVIDL